MKGLCMKKKVKIIQKGKVVEKEIEHIPYFYILMFLTQVFCVLKIINSEENPDYKIPWLLFVY